jgi:topoisomerase IA-like protein
VKKFYDKLNPIVQAIGQSGPSVYAKSARELGEDSDGNKVVALKTKEGYAVARTIGKQAYYANIPKEKLKTIKLKEAIKFLNDAVRILGSYEKGDVSVRKSKAGAYYISYGKKQYCPIDKEVDHTKLKLKHAVKLIEAYKSKQNENVIAEFSLTEGKNTNKAIILKGKGTYPPYIQVTRGKIKTNYSIYPGVDPTKLTEKNIKEMIEAKKKFNKEKKGGSKTAKKPIPKTKKKEKTKSKPKGKAKTKAQNK